MSSQLTKLAFGVVLLALSFGPTAAMADCASQCKSEFDTCMRGCTTDNAKKCVDSCANGQNGCRRRGGCSSEIPKDFPKIGDASCVQSQKVDRKSTRLNSSHIQKSRMPSSA